MNWLKRLIVGAGRGAPLLVRPPSRRRAAPMRPWRSFSTPPPPGARYPPRVPNHPIPEHPIDRLLEPEESVMSLESLQDLLVEELRDLYNAEQQLVKALPRIAEQATTPSLRQAFQDHLRETEGHVTRLEQIFSGLGEKPSGKKCKGMEGLLDEGEDMLSEQGLDPVRDAGIIAAAQRVEHYEIAAYGCAAAFAQLLGRPDIVTLLQQTLDEEKAADRKLNAIAEGEVNSEAMTAGTTSGGAH
ncbi:MAG: YciE/YciF ferroxidase family protein [Gemmatimonadales bacterium]